MGQGLQTFPLCAGNFATPQRDGRPERHVLKLYGYAWAGDWKRMPAFEKLLIIRTLRPDRLTAAMSRFVANTLGKHYVTAKPFDLERSFQVPLPALCQR